MNTIHHVKTYRDCASDLTPEELQLLIDACHDVESDNKIFYQGHKSLSPVYIEVGIGLGKTFVQIARLLDSMSSTWRMLAIDLFEDFKIHTEGTHNTHISPVLERDEFSKLLKQERFKHIGVLIEQGDSSTILNKYNGVYNYGVVFIDGNHTYAGCMADMVAAYDVIKHGYFVLHNASEQEAKDYPNLNGGPWRVAKEVEKQYGLKREKEVGRSVALQKV